MKDLRKNAICSIVTKCLLICSVLSGLLLCFSDASGFMGGTMLLLYFTNQSNIWIGAVALALLIVQLVSLKKGKYVMDKKLALIQQIFTVSITLTGVIYCFVLVPAFLAAGGDFNPFSLTQMLLHVFSPLLAIADFVFFMRGVSFKKSECLLATIPPFYYLFFSMIGYFKHWDFGMGANYPYFFLNYGSPAGLFGFSKEMPYFMGSSYWIAFIVILVSGMSLLYIKIANKKNRKK